MRDNTGARSVVANSDMHTAPQALSDQPATSSSSVKKQQYNGLLHRLSTACRLATRQIAKTGPVAHVYDNINWIMKIAEQILGRSQAQENGTCATIFPLFDAKREDMTTKALLESIDTAPPLLLDDIVLTPDEQAFHRKCTIHTILRILISQGGEHFVRFKKDLENCRPDSDTKIPLHKTDVYPLPAMNINESSIIGNAEVMEAIFEELEQPITEPEFMDEVRIVCGDQLSVTNLRSVTTNRAGDDEPTQTFANVVTIPGLFHAQIHILSGILEKHWGSAEGPQDPGSLHLHNTLLARKPIVLSSLPPYRTCRDLVFVSLYARVFHCLELVAGYNSLEEYSGNASHRRRCVTILLVRVLITYYDSLALLRVPASTPKATLDSEGLTPVISSKENDTNESDSDDDDDPALWEPMGVAEPPIMFSLENEEDFALDEA